MAKKESEVVREQARDLVCEIVPRLCAAYDAARIMGGVSDVTIYRWLGRFFLPRLDQVKVILQFGDLVRAAQAAAESIVLEWHAKRWPVRVRFGALDPKIARLVSDGSLSDEEKVERISKRILKNIARETGGQK